MLVISTIFRPSLYTLLRKQRFLLFIFVLLSITVVAQDSSLLMQQHLEVDSVSKPLDTSFFLRNHDLSARTSWLTTGPKTTRNDFELLRPHTSSILVFLWIAIVLFIFVVIRVLYKRDMQELFQSLMNKQLASQINRSKGAAFSNFSLLLLLVSVANVALMTMYTLYYFYGESNHYTIEFFIKLVFLFTFFISLKVLVVNTLGNLFEEQESAESYVNDFLMILKVLGITVFPTVLMIYVADRNTSYVFVYLFLFVTVLNVLIFIWRGLSTSIQMMYKSMYHFLLYVCTVEVLSVFLLIKLLTKIAS